MVSAALYYRVTPGREHEWTLRPDQPEFRRLAWAFAISIVIHQMCYGAYRAGSKLDLPARLARLAQQTKILAALIPPPPAPKAKQRQPQELPLIFVDVNPAVAVEQAPPNARFYSNRSSEAANPEADAESDMPKIAGSQTDIVKTEDVRRADLNPLRPNFTPAERDQEPERPQPRAPVEVGDLAMVKPESNPRPGDGEAERPRPRTIREAMLRENRNQLVGERMKQDGGVRRVRLEAGLDAKETPFGDYDAMFIEAVQSRWFALLDQQRFDSSLRGKVVLKFRLQHDGRITDMQIVEENVGIMWSLLCRLAVEQPAPYERWARDMRHTMGRDFRDITFTFHYY
jgi:hypothetical protein